MFVYCSILVPYMVFRKFDHTKENTKPGKGWGNWYKDSDTQCIRFLPRHRQIVNKCLKFVFNNDIYTPFIFLHLFNISFFNISIFLSNHQSIISLSLSNNFSFRNNIDFFLRVVINNIDRNGSESGTANDEAFCKRF